MRVVVTSEAHFARTPDGTVYSAQGSLSGRFWSRYLVSFDEVVVFARLSESDDPPLREAIASAPGISFVALPDYLGPTQYLRNFASLRARARAAFSTSSAYILRLPGPIGGLLWKEIRATKHPYALEIVGDPEQVFAPGAVQHPLRPYLRRWFSHQLRRQCAGAVAVGYVTQQTLQRRYPVKSGAFSTYYSSVELPDEAFAAAPRPERAGAGPFRLVTVGSLNQLYKGPHILIAAVARCLRNGVDLYLSFIGAGKHRPELEAQVAALGLEERIVFLGQLAAGATIRDELRKADLFVLPSLTEGLPRAMIEAMALALPCVGSTAGGISELLLEEDMVAPGDSSALAAKLTAVLADPQRMAAMSARNLAEAHNYHDDILNSRRTQLYDFLHTKTAQAIKRPGNVLSAKV